MFGRNPGLSPLELRKSLLIAESDLNRAQAAQEYHAMTEGARSLIGRLKFAGSFASAAGLLGAGFSAFRRSRAAHRREQPSWIQMALKGAQTAASIWFALRSRRKSSPAENGETSDGATSRASFLHPKA